MSLQSSSQKVIYRMISHLLFTVVRLPMARVQESSHTLSSSFSFFFEKSLLGKLVHIFSHELDVTHIPTRPLHVTSLKLCSAQIRRGIFLKTNVCSHLPFPTFLTSCLAVLATRNQFRLSLPYLALSFPKIRCVHPSKWPFWLCRSAIKPVGNCPGQFLVINQVQITRLVQ